MDTFDRHGLEQFKNMTPEEQQALIALFYGEDMSYEAIARATGLREGTVKSRLSRAKAALRARLEP